MISLISTSGGGELVVVIAKTFDIFKELLGNFIFYVNCTGNQKFDLNVNHLRANYILQPPGNLSTTLSSYIYYGRARID